MRHSIIIPHRNRNRQLYQAIWSIERSARASGLTDYEVVLVDHRSLQLPDVPMPCRYVICDDPYGVLNKNRLLNLGLDAARGEILSFLDADMLVGRKWMAGTQQALSCPNAPTRLAYRVRHLKVNDQAHQNSDLVLCRLERYDGDDEAKAAILDNWFHDYGKFTKAFEAYGDPEAGNKPRVRKPVFGNSQFSIRRDVLGGLRFDELFQGAGYEDIHTAWAIWQRAGAAYQGAIFTDPDHALLHIWHGPRIEQGAEGSDWYPPGANMKNQDLYYQLTQGAGR
jgi:hypothetical protein